MKSSYFRWAPRGTALRKKRINSKFNPAAYFSRTEVQNAKRFSEENEERIFDPFGRNDHTLYRITAEMIHEIIAFPLGTNSVKYVASYSKQRMCVTTLFALEQT